MKLKRGQKRCKECGYINASRQRVCTSCGHQFISKNTPIKGEVLEWKNLERGSYIKIVQGTGPYYICTRDTEECQTGEKLCVGSTGVYQVHGLDHNGILAFGASYKNGGFVYLFMGEPYISKLTNVHYEPYRIKYAKKPRIVTPPKVKKP